MKSLPIGIIFIAVVLYYSMGGRENWMLYVNLHSIVIVVGGTVALLFFSTPSDALLGIVKDVVDLFKNQHSLSGLTEDFKMLSETRSLTYKSKDPLINRAVELWEKGINPDLFIILLNQTRIDMEQRNMDSIQALRNLSKYPPALGMAGTVMGLVTLFSNLTQESKAKLGPALALAMTATFFGLIVSNMIVTPLADRLQVKQLSYRRYLTNVFQIISLIQAGETPLIVNQEVAERGGLRAAA